VEVGPEGDENTRGGRGMGSCFALRKKKMEIWRLGLEGMNAYASASPSLYGERCGTVRLFVVRGTHAPHAPHSTRDVWESARLNSKEIIRLFSGRTCARALFGPSPTTLGTVCGPGPGAPVGVLE
jgi:hypothetical protein